MNRANDDIIAGFATVILLHYSFIEIVVTIVDYLVIDYLPTPILMNMHSEQREKKEAVSHYTRGNCGRRHLYQKGRITRRVMMKTTANTVKIKLHVFLQPA